MIQKFKYSIIIVFLSSCVTTRHVSIETLQPAKLTIESHRKNIAVSASSLLSEAFTLSEDVALGSLPADSLIANILYSFQYFLKDMPGYEDANISIYTSKTASLPKYSDFDMLVQLDRLQINNTYYGQQYSYLEWEAFLHVHYVVQWSIRNNYGALLDEHTERDMIIWRSGIDQGKAEAVDNLPNTRDAWWDTGIAIAQRYVGRIAPQWQTGSRSIYMINKYPELSRLAYFAMQNDFYGRAFDIWESMLLSCRKNGQKKTKSQITYNMAVAFEFQNQLEQAIYWTQRSTNLNLKTKNANYLSLLKERQKHQELLNKQLH